MSLVIVSSMIITFACPEVIKLISEVGSMTAGKGGLHPLHGICNVVPFKLQSIKRSQVFSSDFCRGFTFPPSNIFWQRLWSTPRETYIIHIYIYIYIWYGICVFEKAQIQCLQSLGCLYETCGEQSSTGAGFSPSIQYPPPSSGTGTIGPLLILRLNLTLLQE
jgi:hypothetical protein